MKMNQQGFSAVVLIVVIVVLASIGGAGYMIMQNNSESTTEDTDSDEVATTTADGKSANESGAKAKVVTKSKVDVCDILTMEKASSITGVPMRPVSDVNGIPQVPYEDEDMWSSICAYYDPTDVNSSAGISFMLMEALSPAAKAEIATQFESSKSELGGVSISGFGDKAFKVNEITDGIGANQYYVLVGDIMILASSGIGKGGYDEYGRLAYLDTEQTDAVTEEMLRYVLSQIR